MKAKFALMPRIGHFAELTYSSIHGGHFFSPADHEHKLRLEKNSGNSGLKLLAGVNVHGHHFTAGIDKE